MKRNGIRASQRCGSVSTWVIGRLPALCCGVVVGGRVARRVGGVVTVGDVRIMHRACLQTTMKEIKKQTECAACTSVSSGATAFMAAR